MGLVGCVKQKRSVACAARDLYTSPLFVGRRRYVESGCDRWFILSALHGLLDPLTVIEPYEMSLTRQTSRFRRDWSTTVCRQIDDALDVTGVTFEIHAGSDYRSFGLCDGLIDRGAVVEVIAERLGIGQQLNFYSTTTAASSRIPTPSATAPRSTGGAYGALTMHLISLEADVCMLTFEKLEQIIGRPLPPSARRHAPWWSRTQSHARGWLDAGWSVRADRKAETARFERMYQ